MIDRNMTLASFVVALAFAHPFPGSGEHDHTDLKGEHLQVSGNTNGIVTTDANSGSTTKGATVKEDIAASVKEDIAALLKGQADAWNRGDLDAFLQGYLKSDQISYVSSDSDIHGYEALRERYEKKYGNRKETMGRLSFSDLKVSELGKDNALCLGKWHLDRDGKAAINGIFSLVLARTSAGWRIIHDHTSVRS